MTEKFTLFYGGPASQWAPGNFTVDGVVYNCAEQFMMAEKARLFGDDDALKIIMETTNPKIQKATGRLVRNFDLEKWNLNRKLIVYRGNFAKFSQIKDYQAWLLATDGTTLVEASPWDTIWGIGLDEGDPKARDRSTWLGSNDLGEIVTQVREEIKQLISHGLMSA